MNGKVNTNIKTLELDKILALLSEHAVSDGAKELCLNLLPSYDINEVQKSLKQTDDAFVLYSKRGCPSFSGLKNIKPVVERAAVGACLNMRELLEIASTLKCSRGLIGYRSQESNMKTSLDELFGSLKANKYLEEKIFSSILADDEMADSASPELYEIRKKIRLTENKIKELLHKIIHSQRNQKYLQEPIVTVRSDRYVIPVKAEYKNEVPGLVLDTSGSGATVFVEPMSVVEANNELKILHSNEAKEIERILYEFSTEVASFADSILNDYYIAVRLDFIFAKAKLAAKMNAVLPAINDKGRINLKKARHPLINKDTAIPIDVSLGIDYDSLIITGPNTGGKTVSLKTVGLLTLMMQCGLHVPANEGSELGVFENVYADIGDEQSIEQSLSTFSSHLKNIVEIVNNADGKTLVLFDELGAGTDPVEGAALAVSILEYVRKLGSKVIATTHYPELKLYALETLNVENASCEFDVETLKPTYRLITGIPGRSNAFAIALRLGLNEAIINNAKHFVNDDNVKLESIINKLEETRKQLEFERNKAFEDRLTAERLRKEHESLRDKLEASIQKENERAISEAKRIVDNARYEASKLIDELKELKKQKDKEDFSGKVLSAITETKQKLSKLEDEANPAAETDTEYTLPRPLKIGDTVRLAGIDTTATVVSLADKNGILTIKSGAATTKVKESMVRLVTGGEKKPAKKSYASKPAASKVSMPVKTELDIRGLTVLEAEQEVTEFIDKALLAGLNEVSIIHGKGTGALRSGIHALLKGNKSIKSFRLGKFGEGETGVTIVEL